MRTRLRTTLAYSIVLFFGMILGSFSSSGAGPIFVPIPDTTVCEGGELLLIIYADSDTPGEELEFEIENSPQRVEFIAVPPG